MILEAELAAIEARATNARADDIHKLIAEIRSHQAVPVATGAGSDVVDLGVTSSEEGLIPEPALIVADEGETE